MEYLVWKNHYKKGSSQDWLCDLCTKLYDQQDVQLTNQIQKSKPQFSSKPNSNTRNQETTRVSDRDKAKPVSNSGNSG